MTAWITVIGAIFQVVLLLLQSHSSKETDVKKIHADNANKISNAIATGDVNAINAAVVWVRR